MMKDHDSDIIWESYIAEKKGHKAPKKADLDKDGKLNKYEKAKNDAIAKADDDPDTHACATKLEHAEFGVGTPIHARHAQPDENGYVSWYAVMFEHGTEVVDTANVTVLDESSHGSHNK